MLRNESGLLLGLCARNQALATREHGLLLVGQQKCVWRRPTGKHGIECFYETICLGKGRHTCQYVKVRICCSVWHLYGPPGIAMIPENRHIVGLRARMFQESAKVWIFVIFSGAAFIFLMSCSSYSVSEEPLKNGRVNGVSYYLPITKVVITGDFSNVSTSQPTDQTPPVSKKKEQLDDNTNMAPPPPATSPKYSAKPDSSASPKPSASAEPSASAKQSAPPKADNNPAPISETLSTKEFTIVITVEMEADQSSPRLFLKPDRNYFYDDETQLSVNAKGLLSTANATAEDKTAEIATDLAQIAETVLGYAAPIPPPPPKLRPFYYTFHPVYEDEVRTVKDNLRQLGIEFDVIGPKIALRGTSGKASVAGLESVERFQQKGIIFRPGVPFTITLRAKQINLRATKQFVMPDPSNFFVLDYSRMPFVKKVSEIGFTDGMLSDFHQVTPSPVLGFISIPKSILQALIPLPFSNPAGNATKAGTSTSSKPSKTSQ